MSSTSGGVLSRMTLVDSEDWLPATSSAYAAMSYEPSGVSFDAGALIV